MSSVPDPEATAVRPPLISLVVPVYNEAENIQPFLRKLEPHLRQPQRR